MSPLSKRLKILKKPKNEKSGWQPKKYCLQTASRTLQGTGHLYFFELPPKVRMRIGIRTPAAVATTSTQSLLFSLLLFIFIMSLIDLHCKVNLFSSDSQQCTITIWKVGIVRCCQPAFSTTSAAP